MSPQFKLLILVVIIISPYRALAENADVSLADKDPKKNEYEFDEGLLKGSGLPVDDIANYLSSNKVRPGNYNVDVELNGVQIFHDNVIVKENEQICFTQEQLNRIPIKSLQSDKKIPAAEGCQALNALVPHADVNIDLSMMTIKLSVPDEDLVKHPRGYVPPEELVSGETMLVSNYNLNQYYSHYKNSSSGDYSSTWLGLSNAVNLGLWQFRQQGSFVASNPGSTRWHSNRAYMQRAIVPFRSTLLIGDSYTSGSFFSGMGYRGVSLSSDERMLPDSQRGYAPVVRGIARSNAKVTVRQGSAVIYETTVAPGSFVINDLFPTVYSGDLEVTVTEADGSKNIYTVPFSAVPESVRPGRIKYSATLGRSRYVGDDDPFSELNLQYGVSNNITVNVANRMADGYQAGRVGGVYSSQLGAIGIGSTFSHASLPDKDYLGWMFNLSYSKRFTPTDTTVSIAGYRYSTSGYRDLTDVLNIRKAHKDNNDGWVSSTLNQSSRLELSLNQSLKEWGNVWISGSSQQYRDGRKRDAQYQIGYSKQFENGISVNASVSKTRYSNRSYTNSGYNNYVEEYYTSQRQVLSTLSVSIPFSMDRRNTLSTTINHQNGQGSTLQSTLSGVAGTEQPVNYGITYARSSDNLNTFGATAQTNTAYGAMQGSVSQSKNYTQGSAGIQGAAVLHRGGLTLGPYVGDTFALIEAKGAKGAKVVGTQNAVVDRFGYALTPALTPYKYSTIALDSSNMDSNAEIKNSSRRVAAYAGAMLRVKFSVTKGFPMLIDILANQQIPMGANIYNSREEIVGMLGQGNQAWVRNDSTSDTLTIKWGGQNACHLFYKIPEVNQNDALIRLKGNCK